MYQMVVERLNKGHTALAFSLLSKFPVRQFAESASESSLGELVFALKSAFFALSGDSGDGEQNLDFDLPDSAESAELVRAIIAKQASDIVLARPEETARDIIQTVLAITSSGDGALSVWERLVESAQQLAGRELECGADIVTLISNHFATLRHEQDLYGGSVWPPVRVFI